MNTPTPALPDRLREIAGDVRRIGCGYRSDPEAIAMAKDKVAKDLARLAREVEV